MNPQDQKPEEYRPNTPVPSEPPVYNQTPQPVQPRPQVQLSQNQEFVRQQVKDPDAVKHPKFRTKRWQNFFSVFGVIQLLGVALLLAFVINQFIFQSYQVFGESMAPTLHQGDRLIISKLGKTWSSITRSDFVPKRGEVVVFTNTIDENEQLVKRVVGVPGDRVVVNDGEIRVFNVDNPQGFDPDEQVDVEFAAVTEGVVDVDVGDGELFVVGDNRLPNGSLDSRFDVGLVPTSNVSGTLVMRIFPLGDAAFY